MRGKITKIRSDHQNMRTDSMEGTFHAYPRVGKDFLIFGEALDKTKDMRTIHTTPVIVEGKESDTVYVFQTSNSTYKLEVYPDAKDI